MSNGIARSTGFIQAASLERNAYAKVTWRLIPLLFISYVVAYLDRVNVGFAKLQMLADLSFSETVYGLGAGIFFLGYAIFEVPSNIIMHRVGARRWISRIMITWGVLAAAMMFVRTPTMFYVLRFLLGIAEAGFLPGIVLYLTYWYPSHRRGRMMALFFAAIPASGLIGGPLSGWIMQAMADTHGLAGWQWMFLLEALPAVVLGLVILTVLPDGIRKAHWLSEEEKQLLETNIKHENQSKHEVPVRAVFGDPRVLKLTAIYFCMAMGSYGVSFWLPSIIKSTGVVNLLHIGLLTAIPFSSAIAGMLILCRSADAKRERKYHLAGTIAIGAVGLVLSVAIGSNTTAALVALSIAAIGVYSASPLFWSLPTAFLSGAGAAAAIAFINSVANIAGFVSPYLIGWVKEVSGSTNIAMVVLAGAYVLGVILTLTVPSKLVNK